MRRHVERVGRAVLCWSLPSVFAFGCGRPAASPIGYDYDVDPPPVEQRVRARAPRVPEDVVARAAAPIRALRVRDGAELRPSQLARELLRADAICFGEEHGSPSQHYAELWLLEQLNAFASSAGLELGLGLEMFQRPFQRALNAYQQGRTDEAELLRATDYATRWGYPFAFYRPLVERARQSGLPLVALNARSELTREVARAGLDRVERRWGRDLPELDLYQAEHRARFESRMKGHPGVTPERMQNYYAAQVVWDETMAESAATWLSEHAPVRRLLIVAGRAHCEPFAIPDRLRRRGSFRVASVMVRSAPAKSPSSDGADYVLLLDSP